MASVAAADPGIEAHLCSIAARLLDIATCVATESEAATAVIRSMADQASRMAALAAALEEAAGLVESNVRRQDQALTLARAALIANAPMIDALGRSVDDVASISETIAQIAHESRVLSLNARIEAARAGGADGAFAAISREMSMLTNRTIVANTAIGERSVVIARDVGAASEVVAAHGELVTEQNDLLAASLDSAGRQRRVAAELAEITAGTARTVATAAAAIGRVGANAVAVKVLARQVTRFAVEPPSDRGGSRVRAFE